MKVDSSQATDVAHDTPKEAWQWPLNEVGLENVQTQIRMDGQLLPSKCLAVVSLADKTTRGIHMSRLYRIVNQLHTQDLSWDFLASSLENMLASQDRLSTSGRLQVSFELPVLRKALLSPEQGWRQYPARLEVAFANGKWIKKMSAQVLYSSTCPCSAALSRQALQARFKHEFQEDAVPVEAVWQWLGQEEAMEAVPHSQRSEALCEVVLDSSASGVSPLSLIDLMEEALQTPVQAAVKREDEQDFARRNARNLMFCEDAARRLKAALEAQKKMADYKIEVRHCESLHPHDVVARVGKFDD